MSEIPKDDKGRFVSRECKNPRCGNGILQHEGGGLWQCDGLEEPESGNGPLECCSYSHWDGEPS